MAREILFRGLTKSDDPKEWLFGDLNHIDGKVYIFDRTGKTLHSTDCYEVDPETVSQFTNRTDHNTGKGIFKDDLVFVDDSGVGGLPKEVVGGTYKVIWEEVSASFMLEQLDGLHAIRFDEVCTYTVIGSIHDNPELLGKEANNV